MSPHVAVENAVLDHGIALHPQHEAVAVDEEFGEIDFIFAGNGLDRTSGGDAPEQRQRKRVRRGRPTPGQTDTARAVRLDADEPFILQRAQVAVHHAARGNAEMVGDLAQLGRIAVARGVGADEVIHLAGTVGRHNALLASLVRLAQFMFSFCSHPA